MHCRCVVTLSDENVPIRIDGTAQDITELKKTQEKLHESEGKHRHLFENSPEAIAIHDDNSIFYCNAAAVKLSGLNSREELESWQLKLL